MTKSKLRKLLTKPKFRAWLEAKKPRAVVGLGRLPRKCPLARYVIGGTDTYIPDGEVSISSLPQWCRRFVGSVDICEYERITASSALKILDGIK